MSDLLNSASLVMIPSGYAEDKVYSAVPTDGSGDLSFTRSSNGTRINSAGLVEVCPWNLLQQSESFGGSPWNRTGISVTADAIVAPNGTTTADKVESTSSGGIELNQYLTLIGSQTYCASVYMKKGSGNTQMNQFDVYNGGGVYTVRITINFGTGTITQSVGTGATVEDVGNGWYRISAPFIGYAGLNFIYVGSSGDNFPSGQYVYGWGAQLNIGSTAKPYFPTTDRLNVPRLTYQNGGGGCPSLLLEKQSTNLFTYSEQFDNSAWIKTSGSVTANQAISPDGTQNADLIAGEIYQQATQANATTYTMSVFAKKESGTTIYLGYIDNVTGFVGGSIVYTYATGAITVSQSANGSVSGQAIDMGNGWIRVIMKYTSIALVTFNYQYIGSGGSYIYGAQLEASSYATSLINTTSSSATRVADACSKTGISSLIGQTEGVVFVDVIFKNDLLSTNRVISLTETNWLSGGSLRIDVTYANIIAECVDNGAGIGAVGASISITPNTRYKIAFAYKQNDLALYVNGSQLAIQTTTSAMPTCSEIYLNELGAGFGGPMLPTQFNQVLLFKTKLTNAELASLTTL